MKEMRPSLVVRELDWDGEVDPLLYVDVIFGQVNIDKEGLALGLHCGYWILN